MSAPTPFRRRHARVLLWAVVIESARDGALDNVLLLAGRQPEEAERLARDVHASMGRVPALYRYWPQSVREVSGRRDAYRIVLRRLTPPRPITSS